MDAEPTGIETSSTSGICITFIAEKSRKNTALESDEVKKQFVATANGIAQVLAHIQVELGTAPKKIVGKNLQHENETTHELASIDQVKTAEKKVQNRLLCVAFINVTYMERYKEEEAYLENQYFQGVNQYQTDIKAAYSRLMGWTRTYNINATLYNDSIRFLQGSDQAPRKSVNGSQEGCCYKCGNHDHHKLRTSAITNRKVP